MKMNRSSITLVLVSLVVGFGAGYFAHTTPTVQNTPGGFARSGTTGGAGRFTGTGGGLISGTVAAEDSGSITVNTRDGSSHVVLVTPETSVSKSAAGSLSDVTVGAEVMVSGTTNSDGSLSASNIQLRPAPLGGASGR